MTVELGLNDQLLAAAIQIAVTVCWDGGQDIAQGLLAIMGWGSRGVAGAKYFVACWLQGSLLLTWFNFNPSMDM